jgi:soluble lytic murein transglycosylase-like protein
MRHIIHEGILYNSGSYPMKVLLLTLTLALSCFAGEFAVLSTGFRLHVDHHEFAGSTVLLYQKDGGYSELGASMVTAFEQEVELPVATPVAVPAPLVKPAVAERTPRELVESAAKKNGLPPKFVHSVVAAESGYQPNALSPKGAIGLMQLMPATAQAYGADPHDPAQNVEAGAAYLRELLIKYDGDPRRALAAYNAGPGAVAKYDGVPPYAETQTYVERVLRKYKKSTDSESGQ